MSLQRPTKERKPTAEGVEGRGLAKGNLPQQNMPRTQDRAGMPSALERIGEVARRDKKVRFMTLMHHVYNLDTLRGAYFGLKRDAAPGVDGETWREYGEQLEENLEDLSARLKRGAYRAKPVRRVFIPKADGGMRPLGVTTLEDKIVQRATVEVLNQIYEADFLGFSYGFRPGRGQHDALDALYVGILTKKVNWVLDVDIRATWMPRHNAPRLLTAATSRLGCVSITLMRKPLRRPQRTWRAWSSPRLTRCNTV